MHQLHHKEYKPEGYYKPDGYKVRALERLLQVVHVGFCTRFCHHMCFNPPVPSGLQPDYHKPGYGGKEYEHYAPSPAYPPYGYEGYEHKPYSPTHGYDG